MTKSLIPLILQAFLFGVVATLADCSFLVFMAIVVLNATFVAWYGYSIKMEE